MRACTLSGILMVAFLLACQDGPGMTEAGAFGTEATTVSDAAVTGSGQGPAVLSFEGTGDLTIGPVPDPNDVLGDAAEEALCFTVDLVDVRRDEVVGEATDCFVIPEKRTAVCRFSAPRASTSGTGTRSHPRRP